MVYQQKILEMKNIYQNLENTIQIFKEKTHLDCIPGCGDCCNRFEPYISVLEGIVIANWLYQNPGELESFFSKIKNKSEILCPFYKVDSLFHCGIYPIRPFICRTFAFSGKKVGNEIKYSPCLRIQHQCPDETRIAQEYISQGLIVPVYNEEYAKICQIDFLLATDMHPLIRSIEIALSEVIVSKDTRQKENSFSCSNSFTALVRKILEKANPVSLYSVKNGEVI
ncbi:MAG: YkgJ family cysteine cluster protein [Candidatus Brocadiae bacterium]|nr:YkgJ family cysteine cluster protein [Candidatus Brocadiia bacterium]